jgi:F-type H+-transporting ATPase subunit delta
MTPDDRAHAYALAFQGAAWERWLAALSTGADRLAHDPGLLARWQGAADAGERGRILDGLLPRDVDLPVRNLLYTLAEGGDLALLADVVAALRAQVERAGEQRLAVEVTSSVPLTEQECQELRQKLEARFGQNLEMRYRVDPAILGGLIVRAGDKLIDGSLATRLQGMRQAMGVAARG